MPGMGLLVDRDRRAKWGLGEWGGTGPGVSVVVEGIVLEDRVDRIESEYRYYWERTSSLASSVVVGLCDENQGEPRPTRKERTGSGRVCDVVTLEAEILFGGDTDGDTAAAIHCLPISGDF